MLKFGAVWEKADDTRKHVFGELRSIRMWGGDNMQTEDWTLGVFKGKMLTTTSIHQYWYSNEKKDVTVCQQWRTSQESDNPDHNDSFNTSAI